MFYFHLENYNILYIIYVYICTKKTGLSSYPSISSTSLEHDRGQQKRAETMKLTQHIVQATWICQLVSKAINKCERPKSTWKSDMICVCVGAHSAQAISQATGNTGSSSWFIADGKLLNELWLLSITERWVNLKRAWLISRVV